MNQTIQTKGWLGPKGKCDMCSTKKATHWFGDTSVALCNDESCSERNRANWNKMLEEVEEVEEEERRYDW